MQPYSKEDLRKDLLKLYGEERPIHAFCPICDDVLEAESVGTSKCSKCDYVFMNQGNYANCATIKGEVFNFEDYGNWDDSDKFDAKVKELKEVK